MSSESHQSIERRLRHVLRTDAGMAKFLNDLVGASNWTYDQDEDVWVVTDQHHVGPGRGLLIVRRGGSWFKTVLPDAAVS